MSLNAPPDFPTVQFINERLCVSSQISDWSINVQIIVRGHVCVFHFVPLLVHPHIIEAVWCFRDHLFELFDPQSVLLLYIKCFEPPAVFGSLVLCSCTCWTACFNIQPLAVLLSDVKPGSGLLEAGLWRVEWPPAGLNVWTLQRTNWEAAFLSFKVFLLMLCFSAVVQEVWLLASSFVFCLFYLFKDKNKEINFIFIFCILHLIILTFFHFIYILFSLCSFL